MMTVRVEIFDVFLLTSHDDSCSRGVSEKGASAQGLARSVPANTCVECKKIKTDPFMKCWLVPEETFPFYRDVMCSSEESICR